MPGLKEQIEALDLPVPEEGICEMLSKYCDALWKANETVNLTRHTTPVSYTHLTLPTICSV